MNKVSVRRLMEFGVASDYVRPIEECKARTRIVLHHRVSAISQGHNENQISGLIALRQETTKRKLAIVDEFSCVASGFDPSRYLLRVVDRAKELNAVIVAYSLDRLVRHPRYHSRHFWEAIPRTIDLEELKRIADGVKMYTVIHPDATFHEIRSQQIRRGIMMTKIPNRQQKKDLCIAFARKMRKQKFTFEQIAGEIRAKFGVNVCSATIHNWLKK